MGLVRLQKVLAQGGIASRRAAEKLILSGRVTVDGQVIKELGTKVNPQTQTVKCDGDIVRTEILATYIYNKPIGMVTTMSDPMGRPCVGDVLKEIPERVFPVGRLDYDSSGLLVCTNDGQLANRLIHPRYKLEKVYRVWVEGLIDQKAINELQAGIRLEDGWTLPAKVLLLGVSKGNSHLEFRIIEGKNRQIRRMCQALGYTVYSLCRIQIGPLSVKGLATGEIRKLSDEEVITLQKATGL